MSKPSEKFELLYTKTALQDIQKLDRVAKKKIKQEIEFYSQKPFSYAKKLINPSLGSYRWRIGHYRVVFDLHQRKIIILRIGHRREIYAQ